jgi:hypothetical protein
MHGADKNEAAHAIANIGMLAYRLGQHKLGRTYYDLAESYYEKTKNPFQLFLLLNHLREALIAETDWTELLESKIRNTLKQPKAVASIAAEYYLCRIEELKKQPGTWKVKFSTVFPESPTIPAVSDITRALTLEDVSTKFWLPTDFITENDALLALRVDKFGTDSKVRN